MIIINSITEAMPSSPVGYLIHFGRTGGQVYSTRKTLSSTGQRHTVGRPKKVLPYCPDYHSQPSANNTGYLIGGPFNMTGYPVLSNPPTGLAGYFATFAVVTSYTANYVGS